MSEEFIDARSTLKAPVAKRVPKQITMHGETRTDDYFWLREKENPEVIRYLEAENAYTEAVLKPTEGLQKKLYEEMLGRIQQSDVSVPAKMDDFYYYTRTEEGKQYPIYCRKKGSLQAAEQVLLDLNELAKGEKYLRLGNYVISPDHRLLAFATDNEGDETYTAYVKNLETGELLPDRIRNTYYGLEWSNDDQSLIYVTLDEAKRPYRAWRRMLGTDASKDVLLLEEKDERFHLTLGKSRSKRFIFIRLNSAVTSEVHFLEAAGSDSQPRLFAPRQQDIEYDIEHHGDSFYVRTTDGGRNFRLLRTPVNAVARENWQEVLPHREAVMLEAVEPFEQHLVLVERDAGLLKLRVRSFKDGSDHLVEMPEPAYTMDVDQNPEYHTNIVRFRYTSLVTPLSIFDYNMDTRGRDLKKETPVLGGFDKSRYETLRLHATAPDGVKIPISLVWRKGTEKNGKNPLLLYGYGSYGISIDPGFSSDRLSLIDRGFVYAIAHIRGGADLGKKWHDNGKMKQKLNTFHDFIASAEFLMEQKYTSASRLAIMGGSAGGLLMGAVLNMRPDLFKGVIAKVPFVDVLNTATDPTLPLTVIEYEEWGNSNHKEYFDYIKAYSPYDNLKKQKFPNILVTAGLNDPRVSYWEPAKWVARMRTLKSDSNILLLKTNMTAGHAGASGRYERLRETALDFSFLLFVMGIKD